MDFFIKYKQIFYIQEWSYDGSKGNLYIFRGDEKLKEFESEKNLKEKVYIEELIYKTDTVESLHYKIAKYCLKSNNIENIYLWTNVSIDEEESEQFVQDIFKNELKLKKSYINTITKPYFNKEIYTDDLHEYVFKEDFLANFNVKKINKSLNFEYKDLNDYMVFVSPNPFINLNESTSNTVIKSTQKSLLFNFNSNIINFTVKHSILDQIYFKNDLKFDNKLGKMNEKKMEIQNQFINNNDFVSDVFQRIEILTFRVLPYSHDIDLDLKTIFKMSKTNYNIPIIVHKSKYTNSYKVNKLAIHDMDKKQIKLFEDKELKHRDTSFNRSNEVIIYYIKLIDNIFFYFLLNSNGSYKIKYKINNTVIISSEDIKESFALLNTIFDSIDNQQIKRLNTKTNIFNTNSIEIIDFNTNNVLTFKSKINSKRFYDSLENNPFFGNKKSEKNAIKSFQFIDTDNFNNIDTITNFLYINAELDKTELIDKMQHFFKISEDKAIELHEEHKTKLHIPISRKGKNVFALRQYHTAVNIKLNVMSDHSVRIYTSNTQDIKYQSLILYYLTQFLTQNIKLKKYQKDENNNENNENNEISFTDLQDWEDNHDDIDFDNILDGIDIPVINIETDLEDYEDIINDDIIEDNISEDLNTNNSEIDTSEPNKKIDKADYTTFVLYKLYEADRKLFRWKGLSTNLNNYSSKCGNVNYRQPIVISKAEKDNIDKNEPGSYTGYVQTGSTENLKTQNYYICPKIWCRFSRVSITEEEYIKNNNKCPNPYNEEAMFFPPKDAKDNYFINKNNIESHYPSLLNENKHPSNLRLPCCGKKPFVEDNINKKKVANYISNINPDMILNDNQYGNLPSVLNILLNQQSSCFGQIDSKSKCYVRTGNENVKNSLLVLLSKLFKQDIVDLIINTMSVEEYIFLNGGNILKRFIDNEKQFEILDKKNYDIFKTYFIKNKSYVKKFNLKAEYDYISNNSSLNFDIDDINKSILSMSIIREYLIFQSFINFKQYISNINIDKQLDDIQHLLTYKWLNKEDYNFIFLENINDEIYYINPKYYNVGDYYNPANMNVVIYKLNLHYEIISYISQKSKEFLNDIVIPSNTIYPIIKQINIEKSKYFELIYSNPEIEKYILSYSLKCIGLITKQGILMVEDEMNLRYDNVKKKQFVYLNTLIDLYKDNSIIQNKLEIEKTNLKLFVNNYSNMNIINIQDYEYNLEIYKIAKQINSKKKIKESLDVINHSISNFSKIEKMFLFKKILKQNKINISSSIDNDKILHDLIHLPLNYILSKYRVKIHKTDKNEVLLTYDDIIERKLTNVHDTFILNKYQTFDKSSDDLINEISYMKVTADNKINEHELIWTIKRQSLKPVALEKLFPKLEVIDEDINLNKLINIFNTLNQTFNMKIFKTSLSDKIALEYNNNKEKLLNIFKNNPNSTIHKIGKKSNVNDYIKLIDLPDYHYSIFELEIISQLVGYNIVIMGRSTTYMNNGIKFINNGTNNYIFLMYYINKDRHSFKLMTLKDEIKYIFHTDDLSIDQINLLNLS